MAKMRVSDKSERLLQLLMAMRFPDVRRAAAAAGYSEAEIRKGWGLLMAAAGDRLDLPEPAGPPKDDGTLTQLDDWENQWYQVIEATLEFNFPEVHKAVFNGITQTQGKELMVTIPKLLARLATIPPEAKALLAARRVTEAELGNAAALVAKLQTSSPEVPEAEPVDPAARERALADAEARMWAHYLEWSKILRAQVKRPRYLQLMGFGTGSRKGPTVELELEGGTGGDDGADEER